MNGGEDISVLMAMFESLSKRLEGVFTNLGGKGKLTEADVDEAMREVRLALLEADVSLKLVRQFVEHVRAKAVGETCWVVSLQHSKYFKLSTMN